MLAEEEPRRVLGPVVRLDVDALCTVRTIQYSFLQSFAHRQKQQSENSISHWMLNGVLLSTNDALDLVRISPDFLSLIVPHKPGMAGQLERSQSLFEAAFANLKGLTLSEPAPKRTPRPEKLSYVVSVSEAIEITTYVHSAVDTLLRHTPPEAGKPKIFQVVWQAHPGPLATQHRLSTHALYLVVTGQLHVRPAAFSTKPMLSGHMTSALYLQREGIVEFDWKGYFVDITHPLMDRGTPLRSQWDGYLSEVQTSETGQYLAEKEVKIDTLLDGNDAGLQKNVVDLTLETMRAMLAEANERLDKL
jgi:hypothetical protein